MKFTASRLLLTAMFGAVAGMPQFPLEFTSIGPPPAMAADPAGTKAILKIVRGRKELEPADVIREVNQRPVNNVSDFERATRRGGAASVSCCLCKGAITRYSLPGNATRAREVREIPVCWRLRIRSEAGAVVDSLFVFVQIQRSAQGR